MPGHKNFSHENFDRESKIKISSEKSFGLTFGIVFLCLSFIPLLFQHPIKIWALITSLVFFGIAVIAPHLLKFLNLYWARFGLLLNKIVSPVILAILFYFAFLPVGMLLKIFKKDILSLNYDNKAVTYWIKSDETVSSMQDQF